jgi:hypothetical protein
MANNETLRDVITRIVNDGEADPDVIAEHARVLAPRNLIEAALHGMLRELAREVLRGRRSVLLSGGTPRHMQPSSKLAERRQYAQAWLAGAINVAPGEFKALADCTVDDLAYAADYCEQLAESNTRRAKLYRRMADAMRRRNVDTLGELPSADLDEIGPDQ